MDIKLINKSLKKLLLSTAYMFPGLFSFRLPRIIVVEVINRCMLKCPLCPTANAMKRNVGMMDGVTFKRLINQIDWRIDKVDFGYSGEPLMNPRIFEMIDYASKKSMLTGFDTNGMLVESYVEEIISSNLKSITVSLDGISNESLTKFRVGADFNKIISGLKKLCHRKRALGLDFPCVTMQLIVMKHNENEIAGFIELAREIGVEKVCLKSLNLNVGFWLSDKEKKDFSNLYLPTSSKYSRYVLEKNKVLFKNNFVNPCIFPFNDIIILWNGDIALCCLDFNGRHILGNIHKKPIKNIWRSRTYNYHRKLVFQRKLPMCKECNFTEDLNETIDLDKNCS